MDRARTDLAYAVDHIVPVLNDEGYFVEMDSCAIDGQYVLARQLGSASNRVRGIGQGSTASKRIAWALCEVFSKVMEAQK